MRTLVVWSHRFRRSERQLSYHYYILSFMKRWESNLPKVLFSTVLQGQARLSLPKLSPIKQAPPFFVSLVVSLFRSISVMDQDLSVNSSRLLLNIHPQLSSLMKLMPLVPNDTSRHLVVNVKFSV